MKKGFAMIKRVCVLLLALILCLTCLAGCERGELSKAETRRLLGDIRAAFEDGSIWESIEIEKTFADEGSTVEILKTAMDELISQEELSRIGGHWWSGKRQIRICDFYCGTPAEYSGGTFDIEYLTVTVYRSGDIHVSIGAPNSENYIEPQIEARFGGGS